jgi:hypothetical protein
LTPDGRAALLDRRFVAFSPPAITCSPPATTAWFAAGASRPGGSTPPAPYWAPHRRGERARRVRGRSLAGLGGRDEAMIALRFLLNASA